MTMPSTHRHPVAPALGATGAFSCPEPRRGRREPLTPRHRGNVLVLVAAILVLLVITATAFLTRTRSVRAVTAAEASVSARRDRLEALPEQLAQQLAEALFPAPVDPVDPSLANTGFPDFGYASPNWPRLPRSIVAGTYGDFGRYAVDPTDLYNNATGVAGGDGLPDFSYNFAPYEVRPWTNWPALLGRLDDQPGEPGFGDSRWLRSTEPFRYDLGGLGHDHRFSHWPHLTYIPTAENGWRVVIDIADITNVTGIGGLVENLRFPIEQWPQETLSYPGARSVTTVGGDVAWSAMTFPEFKNNFRLRRDIWFGIADSDLEAWDKLSVAHQNPIQALPNLWDLKVLTGPGGPGEEFLLDSKRNIVSRTFADTDGDGITDAFWMLAPKTSDSSLMHLVAVSIVDNGGLLNVNSATRFVHRDADEIVVAGNLVPRTRTVGRTPADIALVGSGSNSFTGTGFLDNVLNAQSAPSLTALYPAGFYPPVNVRWDPSRWSTNTDGRTLMDVLGVKGNPNFQGWAPAVEPYLPSPLELATAGSRFDWWKASARRPFDPLDGATPFGFQNEIELRSFHGQNIPNVLTALERAISNTEPTNSFLRSVLSDREESSEYLDQLGLAAGPAADALSPLLHDNRRKLTTHNATRNDVMPSWLWATPLPPVPGATDPAYVKAHNLVEQSLVNGQPSGRWTKAVDVDKGPLNEPAAVTFHDLWRWQQLQRKFDLRSLFPNPLLMVDLGANSYQIQADEQRSMLRDRLKRILGRTFFSADEKFSYFGEGTDAAKKSRSMVTSFAANIESWMDGPSLYSAGPNAAPIAWERLAVDGDTRFFEDPSNSNRRFLGMEPQPFLMEAFIAHVYVRAKVPAGYPGPLFQGDGGRIPLGMPGEGQKFVDSTSKVRTIVAVQIANPYDTPIVLAQRPINSPFSLGDFAIRVFGQIYRFEFGSCDNVTQAGGNPTWTRRVDTNGDGVPDYEQLLLLPCTEDEPRTAVIYAIDAGLDAAEAGDADFADGDFGAKWRDFLDIGIFSDSAAAVPPTPQQYLKRELFEDPRTPQPDTLRFNATGKWSTSNTNLYSGSGDSSIELLRVLLPTSPQPTYAVVDRIDTPDGAGGQSAWEFRDQVGRLRTDPKHLPPQAGYAYFGPAPPQSQQNYFNGIRLEGNDYFVVWSRAGRFWRNDVDNNGVITNDEKAPRYALATRPKSDAVDLELYDSYVGGSSQKVVGVGVVKSADPDSGGPNGGPWFKAASGSRHKPTYFPTRSVPLGGGEFTYPAGFPVFQSEVSAAPAGSNWIPVQNLFIAHKVGENEGTPPMPYPYQFIHPERGFERVGDLLLVPLWSTVVEANDPTKTVRTFGEILAGFASEYPVEEGIYLNRIRLYDDNDDQDIKLATIVGPALSNTGQLLPSNPNLNRPFLPAGVGLFDAFVCDGPGALPWRTDVYGNALGAWFISYNGGQVIQPENAELRSPRNAGGGLAGRDRSSPGSLVLGLPWEQMPVDPTVVRMASGVPGLVNLNTAPLEVLRTLPHWSWLIHERMDANNFGDSLATLARSRSRVPEAIEQYRNRVPVPANSPKPGYGDRGVANQVTGGWFPGMRATSGLASVGELLLLRRSSTVLPAAFPVPPNPNWSPDEQDRQRASYRIDFPKANVWDRDLRVWPQIAPANGLVMPPAMDSQLSTDLFSPVVAPTVDPFGTTYLTANGSPVFAGDGVAADAEEASLLFTGASNLVTTRSDVFTVYFRVRTVRQNPVTGVWNGTDRNAIVDEARYVMGVDRSEVLRPGQAPRILYLEKLPP